MHQRVVLVAGEDELRDRLMQALGSFSAEAVEVPSVQHAMELTRQIPIQLLVLRYPLEGTKLGAFMNEFRESECASRGAQVVVLAPGRSIGGLKRGAGPGVAILRSDTELEQLEETFTSFLRRAPRFAGGMLLGADLDLPAGKMRKLLQVRNISENGMLLQTKTPLEVGDRFSFELGIAELEKPILGEAEVARVERDPSGGRRRGVGVHVVSWVGDSRERLAKFLEIRRLPPAFTE